MVFKSVYRGHGNIALMVIDSRKTFSPNRGSGRSLNTGKYTNTKSVACYLFTASNARAVFNFSRPQINNNYGAATFSFVASKLWEAIPFELKKLSYYHFYKQHKRYLLDSQAVS